MIKCVLLIVADRVRELSLKYEIRAELAARLHALEDFEILVVCDDSGSMKTKIDGTDRTRWEELKDFVKIILEVGTIFDPRGVDIYFLNRRPFYHVKNPNYVDEMFEQPPRGYTPLVRVLKSIFQLPSTRHDHDKKTLVFVATDGAPTDDFGNINIHEMEHLMVHERRVETTPVMFLVCTDDKTCVDYLSRWDKEMVNVDVTQDFKSERKSIKKHQGADYPFSKGDYIVKALIGAIDQNIDDLNERLTNASLK